MRLITMTVLVAVWVMAPLAVGAESKQSPATQPTACHKEAKAADVAAPGCDAKAPCDKSAEKAVGCRGDKDQKTAAGKCDKSANGDKAECKCTDRCKCSKPASCGSAHDGNKTGTAAGCFSASK